MYLIEIALCNYFSSETSTRISLEEDQKEFSKALRRDPRHRSALQAAVLEAIQGDETDWDYLTDNDYYTLNWQDYSDPNVSDMEVVLKTLWEPLFGSVASFPK